jgi:DNA topoisomerase-1
MNTAVVKLAEAAAAGPRARNAPQALREVGIHPVSGAPIKLLAGRFGQYVADGTTNATIPKGEDGMTLSLDAAVALLDARAAAAPSSKKKPAKKPAAKKPAAKAAAKAPAKAKTKPAAKRKAAAPAAE